MSGIGASRSTANGLSVSSRVLRISVAQLVGTQRGGANHAESAGVGNRGHQLVHRDAAHPGEQNRILDSKVIANRRVQHRNILHDGEPSMRLAPDDIFSLAEAARSSASVAPRVGVMHNRVRVRRGGRARFKAHAWNACRLERVSGVRIPPSPPYSLYCLPTLWRWRQIRRGTWRFCAQCEPEKAMSVQIRRIARDFLHAKKKRVASGFEHFRVGRRPPIASLKPAEISVDPERV